MPIERELVAVDVPAFFLVVPILLIVTGLCSLLWPRTMWFLSEGWKFKNVEPSGCALAATRVGGLLGVILGTAFLLLLRSLLIRA